MTLLNDAEKIAVLATMLSEHIEEIQKNEESTLSFYLESILTFLSTQNSINQQAAFSNAHLFLDNLIHEYRDKMTIKRAIGALIASYDEIGTIDIKDAVVLVEKFQDELKRLPLADAENIYNQRWDKRRELIKVVSGKVDRRKPSFLPEHEL